MKIRMLKQLQLSKKIVKKRKSGTYGTGKAWNSGTCGTGEWEKKEDKCEFYEKQDAYCTKTQNKNCENIENDEKILMIC